jgi:sulfonate transport system substrate-binding protein
LPAPKITTGFIRNRAAALDIWGLAGTPGVVLAESFHGVNLRNQLDPRLDGFYEATLKSEVAFAQANRLIRSPVDIDAWIDRSYVDAAIRDLDLVSFWSPRTAGIRV